VNGYRQAWQGLGTRLGAMSVNQRLILGMVAAAVVISATVFGLWLGREEQAVLFSDLSVEDANQALQELGKRDVKADLAPGGTTILVPASQVHRLRVELAAKGIGSSGIVGFEIFDRTNYGMTEQDYDVKRLRALQGELTKTIESLQGVGSARVHLVMPKASIFRSLAVPPTASVVLSLNRPRGVSQEQVAGIQSLVAGSVEGLTADNVTVLDQHGRALSPSFAGGAAGASDRQLELKKEVEAYLADKAQTMLSSVLGPGRSQVRVDATLNFEQIESQRTVFDPNTVVRSEERNESNDAQTGSTTETSLTNYEVNQTVERIVGQVGGIKQLSVAVSVDGRYAPPADGGGPIYEPLPPEQLENIRRMVHSALGIDLARGDQLEVVNLQFRGDDAERRTTDGLPFGWLEILVRHGGRIVLGLTLIALVLVFRRNLAGALGELATGGAVPARTAAGGGAPAGGDEPEPERFEGLPPMTDQMMEDVREYAAEHPERVAEVVQSWIHEPERSGGR
jgi:flagellar M-ring protein FliF